MSNCPYCNSTLILLDTLNDEGSYELYWYCENEDCDSWCIRKVEDDEKI